MPQVQATLGLDVSDRYANYCLLDSQGQVVEEGRLKANEEALLRRFQGSPCRVVMEAGDGHRRPCL